jgi:hypothetical protein
MVEFFSIAVGVLMFMVTSQTYCFSKDHFLIYPIDIANPSTQLRRDIGKLLPSLP